MVTRKPQTDKITERQVLDYLEQNPNFLLKHPALLELLTPPSRHEGGKVMDLQNFMLRKLQADNTKLRGVNADLIHNTRDNVTAQQRVHSAIISLLSANGLEDLLHVIASDLAMQLDLDAVMLCFEANDIMPTGTAMPGIQILDPLYIDEVMGTRHILLRGEIDPDPAIFGAASALVQSDALIRLYISDTIPDAMLALGSRKVNAFQHVFGGELLAFLGQVVEICITQWITIGE